MKKFFSAIWHIVKCIHQNTVNARNEELDRIVKARRYWALHEEIERQDREAAAARYRANRDKELKA